MYKLLIVDDEPSICEGIKVLIDWKKYKIGYIETANFYLDAVEKGIEFKPDLVILDVCIVDAKGHEIIKAFTKLGINAEYIMISGYDNFSYARDAMKLGARDYILKPINKDELENTVRKILVEDFSEVIDDNTMENTNPILGVPYTKLSNITNKMLMYVEEDYGKSINLRTIADKFKMNSVYLGQLFYKETGMKFAEYLKLYRLTKARDMIEGTSDKISYIIQKVGYTNMNYFYRHFKEYFNITPTEIRESKTDK